MHFQVHPNKGSKEENIRGAKLTVKREQLNKYCQTYFTFGVLHDIMFLNSVILMSVSFMFLLYYRVVIQEKIHFLRDFLNVSPFELNLTREFYPVLIGEG